MNQSISEEINEHQMSLKFTDYPKQPRLLDEDVLATTATNKTLRLTTYLFARSMLKLPTNTTL